MDSRTLLERLRESANALDVLAERSETGVAPTLGLPLRQEADALRGMQCQLSLLLKSVAFLSEASHRLLNLPLAEVEAGLRDTLAMLGQHTQTQRCYLFLLTEDGLHLSDVYGWSSEDVKPYKESAFRGESVAPFSWTLSQFHAGQTVAVPDPETLPPEAAAETQACRLLKIRSYVNAPLRLGGRIIGWLGFDAVGAPRRWTPEELHLVELARTLLVGTLERKRREEQLYRDKEQEERTQSLGILASGLAHEINNPLAFTAGNLEYLREYLPNAPESFTPELLSECRDALAEALEGTGRIQRIVADLRSFSATDTHEVGSVDLEAVIDSTLRMASNQLRHRAQVVRDYARVPRVRGSTTKLGQVLLNLVLNAAQAIPEGRVPDHRITVCVRNEGELVALSVSDTGCGISPENMPRIFEPFFTTREAGVGMGMGLAICRNIINAMGGRISVRSQLGEGTTVSLHLPRSEPMQESAAPAATSRARAATGRRVLVVDDEPRVLDLLRRLLRGHELVTAANGREALERLRVDPGFDVILCDLMMPELTGMDVYRYVRDAHPGLHERIVFISGGAFTTETQRFLQQVRNPVVTKPFEPVHIQDAVTNASAHVHARS